MVIAGWPEILGSISGSPADINNIFHKSIIHRCITVGHRSIFDECPNSYRSIIGRYRSLKDLTSDTRDAGRYLNDVKDELAISGHIGEFLLPVSGNAK